MDIENKVGWTVQDDRWLSGKLIQGELHLRASVTVSLHEQLSSHDQEMEIAVQKERVLRGLYRELYGDIRELIPKIVEAIYDVVGAQPHELYDRRAKALQLVYELGKLTEKPE